MTFTIAAETSANPFFAFCMDPHDAKKRSFPEQAGLLKEPGYTGPIGLQGYGIPGDAREHLARSITAWRKLNQRVNGQN